MNILLVGDFNEKYDEGLKNVAKYFRSYLSKEHNVETLNIKQFNFGRFLFENKFVPDVVHHFTSPTAFSLIIFMIIALKWPKSKKLMSSLHSKPSWVLKSKLIRKILKSFLNMDIMLYQANEELLSGISNDSIFFPNGVDTDKFAPVDFEKKLILREKYGINPSKFVILHVGHITNKRNLEIFRYIQNTDEDYQVLIIGSTYLPVKEDLLKQLQDSGCKVIIKYFPNLEEIYALADCYVFPVKWGNTISMPLTILEAMASNLPIVSLEYPFFSILNLKDISTYENLEQVIDSLKILKINANQVDVTNRAAVIPFSWKNLSKKLEKLYMER